MRRRIALAVATLATSVVATFGGSASAGSCSAWVSSFNPRQVVGYCTDASGIDHYRVSGRCYRYNRASVIVTSGYGSNGAVVSATCPLYYRAVAAWMVF